MNNLELLTAYNRIKGLDDKQCSALKVFCEVFSPDTYGLIFTGGPMYGFLEALKVVNKDLYEDFSYYTYEVPMMDGEVKVTKDGLSWNFKNENEFLDYLDRYYGE